MVMQTQVRCVIGNHCKKNTTNSKQAKSQLTKMEIKIATLNLCLGLQAKKNIHMVKQCLTIQ